MAALYGTVSDVRAILRDVRRSSVDAKTQEASAFQNELILALEELIDSIEPPDEDGRQQWATPAPQGQQQQQYRGPSFQEQVRQFFADFGEEIRDIICNPKRKTPASTFGKGLPPLVSALASFIAQQMGMQHPVAVGIAAYILLLIGEAGKGAFCRGWTPPVLARR